MTTQVFSEIPRYSSVKTALQATCQAWCDEQGYCSPFCQDGLWWAFPPNGVMPVRVKDVMSPDWRRLVRVGVLTLELLPNGALAPSA